MNWRIDGAKCGAVNEYTNYPEIEKKINKATSGPNGRLPSFFAFTKNGRRDLTTSKRKRKWAKPNNSTMNRICRAFDDIGNINMNWTGINPFNWQMLTSKPCLTTRKEIVSEFCDLDSIKRSYDIQEAEMNPTQKDLEDSGVIIDEFITESLIEKFGSLEECFPYITKYLFAGKNAAKASHKQTYWRIFGDIAVANLKKNLKDGYEECPLCRAKIPKWSQHHSCPKSEQGFDICIDCGKRFARVNSKQQRCEECQSIYTHETRNNNRRRKYQERKEMGWRYTIFSQFQFKKMSSTEPFGRPMSFVELTLPLQNDQDSES